MNAPGTSALPVLTLRATHRRPPALLPVACAALLFVGGPSPLARAAVPFTRGDTNSDGQADLSDAVTILSYLFLGGVAAVPLDALDVDDSGVIDISNGISLLGFLFLGNNSPAPPYPGPGLDPTPFDPLPGGDGDVYDLLVITPQEFLAAISPLVAHKSSTGMATLLLVLEDLYDDPVLAPGRDPQEKIKLAIHSLYESFGIRYVLVVGDANKFPVRYGRLWDAVHYGHRYFPTDLYYADVHDGPDGNIWDLDTGTFSDWDQNENGYFSEMGTLDHDAAHWGELNTDRCDLLPEVAVGRLPASNVEEVQRMVEKIRRYENDSGPPWTKRVLIVTGDWSESNQAGDRIAGTMQPLGYMPIRHYWDVDWPRYPDIQSRANLINTELAYGYGLVTYLGHGARTDWSGWYRQMDIGGAQNPGKLPIVLASACGTASFHFDERLYLDASGDLYSEYGCTVEEDARLVEDGTFEKVQLPGDPRDSLRLRSINVDPSRSIRKVGSELKLDVGQGDAFLVVSPQAGSTLLREFWRSLRSHNFPNRFVRHQFLNGHVTELSSPLDGEDATFRVVSGLADPSASDLVSFESWNYPGWFLVDDTRRLLLRRKKTCSAPFDESATFRIVPGLADASGVSLESVTRPAHYIRHWNFQLYIDPGSGNVFEADATYHLEPPVHDPTPSYCSLRVPDSDDYVLHAESNGETVCRTQRLLTREDEIKATFRMLPGLARPDDEDCLSLEALVGDESTGRLRWRSEPQHYVRHEAYTIKLTQRNPVYLRDLPEPAPVQPASYEVDSMAEWFLVRHDGGAIAYVGGHTGVQPVALEFVEYFFEELADEGDGAILGDVWTRNLRRFVTEDFPHINMWWGDWYATAIYEHVHKMMLFGDPSLRIGGSGGRQ